MNIVILHAWLCAKLNIKDQRGAGLAEYALLLALVAVAAFTALQLLGKQIGLTFTDITTKLTPAS